MVGAESAKLRVNLHARPLAAWQISNAKTLTVVWSANRNFCEKLCKSGEPMQLSVAAFCYELIIGVIRVGLI